MARAGGPLPGVPFWPPHVAHGGWAPVPVPLVPVLAPTAGEDPAGEGTAGEETAGEESAGEDGAGEGTVGEAAGGKAADRGAAAPEVVAGNPRLGGAGM
jgi:hypothetical protein